MIIKLITPNKKGISSLLIVLIIIIFILLLTLFFQRSITESFVNSSNERQCLTLINNIDSIIRGGNLQSLRTNFNEYCITHETKINNQQQFIQEIIKCNNRAQRMLNQRRFLEENPQICIPCSLIQSSSYINIQITEIFRNQENSNNIENQIFELRNLNEEQILQFKINNNNKIVFEIKESSNNECINFLN